MMTAVHATRLYLTAVEYEKKTAELARQLRRARTGGGIHKDIVLLTAETDELAGEINRLEGRNCK